MAGNSNTERDPEELRREIEQTRANMSQTVTILEARLNPQTLKQQASDTIRENTVGRVEDFADNAGRTVKGASADVFDTIKNNPLPSALAFIGLGWLFMESRNQNRYSSARRRYARRYAGERYPGGAGEQYTGRYTDDYGDEYDYGYEASYTQGAANRRSRMGRAPMDRMRDASESMQDKAGQVASTVQDKASQVTGSVQDTAGQVMSNVQETAGQVAAQAQEQAYQVKSRFEDLLDENPLIVGAAAAALGLALGFTIPPTPKENELLGPARDKVMEKAQNTAQDTMQKVQNVAEKAGQAAKETAKDEAQKQNLTPS